MSISLNKPAIGSTGWGTDVNDNWTTIEDAIKLPKNYIAGLLTSNDSTDADHDVNISKGVCRDVDDTEDIELSSILTKQIDASWSEGNNQGGLDTGSVAADTLYAIWVIKKTSNGTVDALFSTSFSSPTMPSGYDKKRLIAAVVTDSSSNILTYTQSGDYFGYGDSLLDINDTTVTAGTFETGTLSVPPNCLSNISPLLSGGDGNDSSISLRTKGAINPAGVNSNVLRVFLNNGGTTDVDVIRDTVMLLVNDDSQIDYTGNGFTGSQTIEIRTYGFLMTTRCEPN